jgi:hypothetical protein
LDGLPSDLPWAGELVRRLVGDDGELFARLLEGRLPGRARLAPLGRAPLGSWPSLAVRALDAGLDPVDVARAAFAEPWGLMRWTGSDHWSEWQTGFAALAAGPDARLRSVGKVGLREAERRIAEARLAERHEAVYGDEWV